MFQLHRKRFSVRRNASKRWRAAQIKEEEKEKEWDPNLVIKTTNMCEEMQRQALEVAHSALTANNVENKVASQIKTQFDELHGTTWHCIVGRNFGSHVSFELYIHFLLEKISIILFKCG
ncbi:hypothetical protein QR680_002388 [Steinernema hermaphroditum]|uniref:Dynein light chain n=1 Tax=Steinernema hermaphroditum TaxID=289476 RepID=A0AA39H2H6_9BILA|nr:hypothetical protein QR680_002388 [Steinernema hermaphroditum]